MVKRVCPERYCPNLTDGGRCPEHRPTTAQRGYGSAHQRTRKAEAVTVNTGQVICARSATDECLMPSPVIEPGSEWALDHNEDRTEYIGPSHKLCNDAAGGRASQLSQG